MHPAVVAASLSALAWLNGLGVAAVAAAGHGLGEITGLVWAGCLSGAEAARLVIQRAALLAAPPADRTALVCVDAGGPESEALCADSGLVIAAYNGPRCHVLAGPAAAVRDLAQRLAEEGVPARLLDSPVALHSPAMADRVAPMRNLVREFSFRPPARRLISTVTGAEVTAGDDIAAMLCTQLTSPVLFARALECAAAEADLLIETGPGRKLSCLAADCSDLPAFSLAAGRPDESATAHAAAALFGSGAVPTLAPLFAGRLARPIDIWRERIFIPSPCGAPAANGDSAGAGRQATDGDMTGRVSPADRGLVAGRAPATDGGPSRAKGRRRTSVARQPAVPRRAADARRAAASRRKRRSAADRRAAERTLPDGRVSHGGAPRPRRGALPRAETRAPGVRDGHWPRSGRRHRRGGPPRTAGCRRMERLPPSRRQPRRRRTARSTTGHWPRSGRRRRRRRTRPGRRAAHARRVRPGRKARGRRCAHGWQQVYAGRRALGRDPPHKGRQRRTGRWPCIGRRARGEGSAAR